MGIVYSLYTLGVENFDEIALSPMVKEIEAFLSFRTFSKKFENSKWPPILNFRQKMGLLYFLHTLGVQNFAEIALSLTVKEIA